MPLRFFSPFVLLAALFGAVPAAAQSWGMVEGEGDGGAGAYICPIDDSETGNFLCFRLGCTGDRPLSFDLSYAGGAAAPEELPIEISVDGDLVGRLSFSPEDGEGYTLLAAPFDPRLHPALVDQLRRGNRALLSLGFPDGGEEIAMSLRGSDASLGAVMASCPLPETPPENDPAAQVLDEIVAVCSEMGGSVALEPGFARREDLDGDGREDLVIDYASAICSRMTSLYCGSGGCSVGFYLDREAGYQELSTGVIRGYSVLPGGHLALDLHGTACGLYGFEACRRLYDISTGAMELVEELAGDAAEAAMEAEGAAPEAPSDEPQPGADGGLGRDGKPGIEGR